MTNNSSTPPTESTLRLGNLNTRTKKVLGFLIAIALILIGALFIYAVLVGPSKEPYRDALTQYKNVYNANVALTNSGSSLNATGATDEEFETNIKKIHAALASLETENEALGKHDVLQNGEGKALYDSFTKKLQQYLAYNENIIASIATLRPVLYECTGKLANIEDSERGADEMRTCAATMGAMKDLPDADYKGLASRFEGTYSEIANNIEAVANLADPQGADKALYDTLMEERTRLLKDFSDSGTALSKDLQTHRAEVDITDEAKALDDYLKDKSRVF